METLWKTEARYSTKITPVQCTRQTAKTVTLAGTDRARSRHSAAEQYHRSWEDAHAYLYLYTTQRVTDARAALARATSQQGNVRGMKKPKEFDI